MADIVYCKTHRLLSIALFVSLFLTIMQHTGKDRLERSSISSLAEFYGFTLHLTDLINECSNKSGTISLITFIIFPNPEVTTCL